MPSQMSGAASGRGSAFDVHVHAIFHLCRAAIPAMQQKKRGAIILISSAAGIRGIKTNVAYQAVKGTLPQLTRSALMRGSLLNCGEPERGRLPIH